MTLPKRTCDEWVTIFRVAPEIKPVFGEGPSDARLIEGACLDSSPKSVDFRSADEVDLPGSIDGGNRTRLIELAKSVAEAAIANSRFLVDRDFGVFASEVRRFPSLDLTDFSNLVSGCVTKDWLRGFLLRGFNVRLTDVQWDDLCSELRFAFCVRFVTLERSVAHSSLSFFRFSRWRNSRLEIDRTSLVRSYVTDTRRRAFVEREASDLCAWITGDPRDFFHSEDLFEYIHAFLRRAGKIAPAIPVEGTRAAILASLPSDLGGQPTVQEIVNWVNV